MIDAIHALVVGSAGEEQIVVDDELNWVMIAVDEETLVALRAVQPEIAEAAGQPVELVRFDRFTPQTGTALAKAIRDVVDFMGEPCWFDHNGDCQAHALQSKEDCFYPVLKAYADEHPE